MKRIFIAINLPEEIKARLGNIQREVADMFPEEVRRGVAKWVETENLHLTLLFIGEVKEEALAEILQAVKEAAKGQHGFEVKFQRVCYGPSRKLPPRLIWVEGEKNRVLAGLVERLRKEVLSRGVVKEIEERPFVPHLTLARIKQWAFKQIDPEERPDIEQSVDLSFEVSSIDLMESKLNRTGAEYAKLKEVPLV